MTDHAEQTTQEERQLETLATADREYRDHGIRVTIEGPPTPSEGEKVATVTVYDGNPPTALFGTQLYSSSRLESWEVDISAFDSEDEIEDAIERAKDFIDSRHTHRYGAAESLQIALERTLPEPDDDEGGDA